MSTAYAINTADRTSPAAAARPILLVGAAGMLGRALRTHLANRGDRFLAAAHNDLNIRDADAVAAAVRPGTRLVINAAAWTDVDGAEEHEAEATEVNATAVAHLAEACRGVGATLVTFGTDYVFDGRAIRPYPADYPRSPVGAYGRSKAAGEEALERSGARWLNIRTSWLYAPWGRNFVRTIAKAARERDLLGVVDDQRGRPTSAEHLARTAVTLAELGAQGIYHVTDGGQCTWYQLACEIVRLTGAPARVEPCATGDVPRPAPRPAYSVLDLSKTEALVGPMPHWKHNLKDVLSRLEPL